MPWFNKIASTVRQQPAGKGGSTCNRRRLAPDVRFLPPKRAKLRSDAAQADLLAGGDGAAVLP
jgi:hypothetical protein